MKERARYKEYIEKLQNEEAEALKYQETAIDELYKFLADPKAHLTQPAVEAIPQAPGGQRRMGSPDGLHRGGRRHGLGRLVG